MQNNQGRVTDLLDGAEAAYMGDGIVAVMQPTDKGVESVVLSRADLERLLAVC